MATVSNSSALIALAQIGQLDLLPRLFGSILIPPAVAREVSPSLPILPSWIQVRRLDRPVPSELARPRLDVGEREALALSIEAKATLLILDDFLARRTAQALGLPVTGTVGILVVAKERAFVGAVRPHLDKLIELGFFISKDLYRESLQSAGELSG